MSWAAWERRRTRLKSVLNLLTEAREIIGTEPLPRKVLTEAIKAFENLQTIHADNKPEE